MSFKDLAIKILIKCERFRRMEYDRMVASCREASALVRFATEGKTVVNHQRAEKKASHTHKQPSSSSIRLSQSDALAHTSSYFAVSLSHSISVFEEVEKRNTKSAESI